GHERVSFEQAVSMPELRQEYLDQRMRELGVRCAASFVYDPSDTLVFREMQSRRRFYLRNTDVAPLLFGVSNEAEMDPATLAFTATFYLDQVGGHKPSVFIRPAMFDFVSNLGAGDGLVEQILAVHEEKHACTSFDGLEIRGRRFSYGELTESLGVLHYVSEITAYGSEIEKRGLDRGDYYQESMVGNFIDFFDMALLTELDMVGAWASFDYQIPSRRQAIDRLVAVSKYDDAAPLFILRMTALDHRSQVEEIESRSLDTIRLDEQAWLTDSHRLHLNVKLAVRFGQPGP
ncbi:MAG TPA: hypothetical protein VLD37_04930, partial [Candidatus Bilamarchaeum sp.]|nr:hypothetical protein [Candidatus Bilamarchaeum sp.]